MSKKLKLFEKVELLTKSQIGNDCYAANNWTVPPFLNQCSISIPLENHKFFWRFRMYRNETLAGNRIFIFNPSMYYVQKWSDTL